jgi:hypothetical protein
VVCGEKAGNLDGFDEFWMNSGVDEPWFLGSLPVGMESVYEAIHKY